MRSNAELPPSCFLAAYAALARGGIAHYVVIVRGERGAGRRESHSDMAPCIRDVNAVGRHTPLRRVCVGFQKNASRSG